MHVPEPDLVQRLAPCVRIGRTRADAPLRIWTGPVPDGAALLFPDRESLHGHEEAFALIVVPDADPRQCARLQEEFPSGSVTMTRDAEGGLGLVLVRETDRAPRLAIRWRADGVPQLAYWAEGRDFARTHLLGSEDTRARTGSLSPPMPLPSGGWTGRDWASVSEDGRTLHLLRVGRLRASVLLARFDAAGALAGLKIAATSSLRDALGLFARRLGPALSGVRLPDSRIRELLQKVRHIDDRIAAEAARRDAPVLETDGLMRASPEDAETLPVVRQAAALLGAGMHQIPDDPAPAPYLALPVDDEGKTPHLAGEKPGDLLARLAMTRLLGELVIEEPGHEAEFNAAERGTRALVRALVDRNILDRADSARLERPFFRMP